MDTSTNIRILGQVLRAMECPTPTAVLRRVAADFSEGDDAHRIVGCLNRLGIDARPLSCRAEDSRIRRASGGAFLLLQSGQTAESSYLFRAGRVIRIPHAQTTKNAETIGWSTFLEEAGLKADSIVQPLRIERRPTLDRARDAGSGSRGPTPFQRLRGLFAPDSRDIAIVILFSIGVGVLSLATPIAVQSLVNFVAFGGLVQPLFIIGILLFAFLAMAGAIRTYKSYIVEVLQRRIFVRVVGDLAYRLPRVRIDAFDRRSGPELVNRFFDVLTVQKASATFLLDGVGVLLQAFIGLLILAFYHPFLLAFDIVLIAAILFVVFILGRGAVRTAIQESKSKYAVAASLEEIALNPLTFKQSGGCEFAWYRTDLLAADYVRARKRHFGVVVRQIIGAVTLQAIAGTALLTLGGFLVIEGELTLGQLVASELIVSIVLASFAKFGKHLESIYDLLAGVDKLGQLIDLPLERQTGEAVSVAPGPASISLVNVCFAYDDADSIIEKLSLKIEGGERVLITGDHGTGKSTLSDLLCGARSPDGGRIELDGVDIRELNLDSIRRQVAVVKGLEIVEGTIAENVRLNRLDISNREIRDALAAVGLMDAIRALPDGIETHVNNFGRPLSYGQARRLMVARAIAGKPRVIVLDNLLDDLDSSSRADVISAILGPDHPWTAIVMSHVAHEIPELTRTIRLPVAPTSTDSADLTLLENS